MTIRIGVKMNDPAEASMLGLQLVNTLAQKMGGIVEVDRSKGTLFSIVFEGKRP